MKHSFELGKTYSWKEVSIFHKSRNGIYQKNGELISLLTDFGKINPCYPDWKSETADEIFYTGAGRRGNQKLDIWNRAMLRALDDKKLVPLFCKIRIGVWKYLGIWQIRNAEYIFDEINQRMVWKFNLKKVLEQNRN